MLQISHTDLNHILNRPLAIGNKTVSSRIVFASVSELGNIAFRELLDGFGGCGLMFGEMWNAKMIPHENRKTSLYFRWRDAERTQLVGQLLGNDPQAVAEAARRLEGEGFFGVDLNFSCSAKTICSRQMGAALLKDPAAAVKLVAAVRKAVSFPLFVKLRTGWQEDPQAAVALAYEIEAAGADALTFHPRTAPDRRTRPPKWDHIRMLKAALSIPVLGNGNIFDKNDAKKMFADTGCDGIALARLALIKPWIFSDWTGGETPDADIYKKTPLRLIDLLCSHYQTVPALKRFKKYIPYYAANFRYGHHLYRCIQGAADFEAIKAIIEEFFNTPPEFAPEF